MLEKTLELAVTSLILYHNIAKIKQEFEFELVLSKN